MKQYFQSEKHTNLLPYCINNKKKGFVAEAPGLDMKAKLFFWNYVFQSGYSD